MREKRLPYLTNVGLAIGMIGVTACAKDVEPTPPAAPTAPVTPITVRKPTEIPGVPVAKFQPTATPVPTPTPDPDETLRIILMDTGETDQEFIKRRIKETDTLEVVRSIFKPEFLTPENLGGELEVEQQPSQNPDEIVWRTPRKEGSKVEITVTNTYPNGKVNPRDLGPRAVTSVIKGKVEGFPWKPFPVVKNPNEIFEKITKTFSLKGIAVMGVHKMPDRTSVETGEHGDLVLGFTAEGVDQWGRTMKIGIRPNGEFEFTFAPKEKRP